ncbi:MAG: hypothetical protein AB7O24_10575 [Kofleriaceae bacterium]
MPSRLSSLLVRDGLVGVKRMEKAFQRQVIYGGSLDTILLEMNLVPEDRLTQYLALASGLPPAARDEGTTLDPTGPTIIPKELAEQYRVVPLSVDGESVRVLVCSPLEISDLEDLADALDRPLQPLIAPEYRWYLVFAAAYGLDPPARFTTLARARDPDGTTIPVGRARTVIIDELRPDPKPPLIDEPVPAPVIVADAPSDAAPLPIPDDTTERTPALAEATMRMESDYAASEADAPKLVEVAEHSGRDRRMTLVGVMPHRSFPGATSISPRQPLPTDGSGHDVATAPLIAPAPSAASSGANLRVSAPIAAAQPPPDDDGTSALTIVHAREILTTAQDRDTVFQTLLRAARSVSRWAGLLTVQGGAAIGRLALSEPDLDTSAINTVLIPLDTPSPFSAVVQSRRPHVGKIVSGDPGIDSMVARMGGTIPPSALILPIVIRERVVSLVVAHRVQFQLRMAHVTELLPLANAASEAIGRLIMKHKSTGFRAPEPGAAVAEVDPEMIDTGKLPRTKARNIEAWSAPAEPPEVPPIEEGVEVSMVAEPPRPIDEVIDEIEATAEGDANEQINEAVERPQETIGALVRRFPGKLRVDRFAVSGRALRASQYGGLLELTIRLGSIAAELLIDKMNDPKREVRFYATVCAAELRPLTAVFALAERLFDQDFGVRSSAIEGLAGYPLADLNHALNRARRAVDSQEAEVVAAATAAIVALGDIDAISHLIDAVERSDRGGDHARKALTALTAQDFGPNERKWRKWWDGARKQHRIEWLIEGLGHKSDAIREAAINDLRRLTGEYFGYHHDLPRRERDAAAARWAMWWKDVGLRRFVIKEDERMRPTAILPGRE